MSRRSPSRSRHRRCITLIDPPYGADRVGRVGGDRARSSSSTSPTPAGTSARRGRATTSPSRSLFAVVLAVGTAFEPSFAILQTFLYPFVWSTAHRACAARSSRTSLIAVAIVVGYFVRFGPAGILTGVAIAALSVGFSIALGLWITRIAEYGEERARLLDELQAAQGQLAAMHRDAGRHRRAGAARPRDPRHDRAEPHGPRDGRAAGGQPARRGRRRGRGIRARRRRAHRADGARGAHRGARARRLARAGRGRRRPRRRAATARRRRSSARPACGSR